MNQCCRHSDLHCKEVVNICDGSRLGFVSDVEIDLCTGRVAAIIVPAKGKLFSLSGKKDDWVIPWECIRSVGEDLILVETIGHPAVGEQSGGLRQWVSQKL